MAKKKRAGEAPITEAIGYIRVSTQDQAASGLGLDAQRARIEAYCIAKGWRLTAVYDDRGLSAKTLDRPALTAAIRDLRPGRILLAYKLDRLTRTARDLDDLTEKVDDAGSGWATVEGDYDTSTAMGRFMVRIVADIAQMEREVIAERTCAALEVKGRRGERLGTTPLGYITEQTPDGPRIAADPEGQETVRLAREMRQSGKSFRQIARALTEAGRRTKRGGKWAAATVRGLIEPRYLERMADAGESPGGSPAAP